MKTRTETNSQPKVSVVVPIYGVEKYLNQCVDSILVQTLKDIEVILVDDGSKDKCPQIVDEYAKKDKRVVAVHQPNGGYGKAVNHGISLAHGKYIGIVESDDWIEKDMYESLYSIAEEKDLDVVKSNFYYYWSKSGENKIVKVMPEHQIGEVVNPQTENEIFWSMPCIWAAIYKYDFLQKNNIRFLETAGASYQDTSFNFKVWASAHRVSFTNKAFLHYRQDNEQSSVNSKKKTFCICDEYNEIERFINEKNMSKLIPLMQRLKWASYMWNFERLIYPLNFHFLLKMRDDFKTAKENGLISKNLFEDKQYCKLKKMIKHPYYFFIKSQIRKMRKKHV